MFNLISVIADVAGIIGFVVSVIAAIQATKAAQSAEAARRSIQQLDLCESSRLATEKAKLLRDLFAQNNLNDFRGRAQELRDWCIETRYRYTLDITSSDQLENTARQLWLVIRDSRNSASSESVPRILDSVFHHLSEFSGRLQQEVRRSDR